MTYIGEIVRLVLTQLEKKGLLFSSAQGRSVLKKKECFTADFVSLIERSEMYALWKCCVGVFLPYLYNVDLKSYVSFPSLIMPEGCFCRLFSQNNNC